jgi:ABC-type dipeptide/oligopeptide/nickel transport system ATPase component
MNNLLEIKNLHIHFKQAGQTVKAVEGVSLTINEGEILALVGESGSGKTMTGLSITRILPKSAEIISGEIIFQDKDLLRVSRQEIESIRGREVSYIFQEAAASLNPVLTIGRQLQETITLHQKVRGSQALALAEHFLTLAHLRCPREILKSYPHQLSGGMNQRVMIAMALSSNPKLLIADEPTTALDVTIEAEVIRELLELKEKLNFSILFITHNLALVEKFAHRIAIMYKGGIVETGFVNGILNNPSHPHTRDLISSIVRL